MTTLELTSTTSSKEHTETVLWTIPASILSKQKQGNVIQTSCSIIEIEGVEKSNYELKMEFSQMYEVYIYFLSRVTKGVEAEITVVKPPQNVNSLRSEYRLVQAHKWQYLTSINTNYYRDFVVLRFKFTAEVNDVLDEEFTDNIEDIFYNELFSDAAMKSADGDEYKVHKAILATRSSVFKAHFTHNTTETITNIIQSPFESKVLSELLVFIYSNRVPNIYEMPEKLLAAADFYQLDRLKKLCEMVLCNNLTVENVIENLQLAELYSMDDLKNGILEFIMNDKKAHGITKTEAWNKFTSVTLIKFLYENVTKKL